MNKEKALKNQGLEFREDIFLRGGRQNQGGDAQGKRFFSVRWLLDVWGFV
ncbi:MAG: hypothetical protein ACLT5G_07875 [Blautia wexlerae]